MLNNFDKCKELYVIIEITASTFSHSILHCIWWTFCARAKLPANQTWQTEINLNISNENEVKRNERNNNNNIIVVKTQKDKVAAKRRRTNWFSRRSHWIFIASRWRTTGDCLKQKQMSYKWNSFDSRITMPTFTIFQRPTKKRASGLHIVRLFK